jgi:hypothetical protein
MHDFNDFGRDRESWVFLIFAMWGGLCHYIGGVRAGKRPLSLFELAGDLAYSAFAGIMAAALCIHFELSEWMTFAVSGMAGHMGSRTIFLLEQALKRKIHRVEDGD